MALKRSPGGSAIYDARRRRATALSGEQLAVPGAEPLTRQDWNTDHWETPWEVVRTLEEEFGPFYLDPCATAENRKAPNWWDERDDGLRQPWTGPAFCNPPYSSIDAWIRKAVAEQARGQLVVMLLPVRTDRDWWHDLVQPNAEVRFLRGRQRFIGPDGTTTGRPVFASAIAVFRPGDHHAYQTYPRPLPWHLRPWRLSGVLTPTRTRGEVGFNLNGSFVDIWIRIAGRERWFAVDAFDLQQSLRAVGTFSLAAESDGNAEVSEV